MSIESTRTPLGAAFIPDYCSNIERGIKRNRSDYVWQDGARTKSAFLGSLCAVLCSRNPSTKSAKCTAAARLLSFLDKEPSLPIFLTGHIGTPFRYSNSTSQYTPLPKDSKQNRWIIVLVQAKLGPFLEPADGLKRASKSNPLSYYCYLQPRMGLL